MVSRTSGMAGAGGSAAKNYTQTQTGMESVNKSGTSQTSQSQSGVQTQVSDYMDPVSRAALNQLIQSLSGATSQFDRNNDNRKDSNANKYGQIRLEEIAANQASRGEYSKANAFADAMGAMQSQLAKGIESQMPTITAGIDAAGTSGSAMAALLTQQAAQDAARNAAELGLTAAVNYGQLQVGFGDIIERLSKDGDPSTNQLLSALSIAKGASENTTATSQSSSSSNTTSNETAASTSMNTTTGKETVEEDKGKPASSYAFKKFPGMSTPGYSKQFKQQVGSGSGNSSTTYKGAYGQ